MKGRRTPVRAERYVVGFYLHEKAKNDRGRLRGCGDVCYWTTQHPTPDRLTVPEDDAVNGQPPRLFDGDDRRWVVCVSCGSYVTLHLRRYRAVPRPDDRYQRWTVTRAMDLTATPVQARVRDDG